MNRRHTTALAAALLSTVGLCSLSPQLYAAEPESPSTPAAPSTNPRLELLTGVRSVATPGLPGNLILTAPNAFAILTNADKAAPMPVIAAATRANSSGTEGRVVVMAHTGYFDADSWKIDDTGTLLGNAIAWASRTNDPKAANIAVFGGDGLVKDLKARGYNAHRITKATPWNSKTDTIALIEAHSLSAQDLNTLPQLLGTEAMPAAIVSGLGWGYRQLNPNVPLVDHPGSRLLSNLGIAFGSETIDDESLTPDDALADQSHAGAALQSLKSNPASSRAANVVVAALSGRCTPEFHRELESIAAGRDATVGPDRALNAKRSLDRVLLMQQLRSFSSLKPTDPLPPVLVESGKLFPGTSTAATNPNPTPHTATLNAAVPGWHALGIYLTPGQTVTARIPANTSESIRNGIQLQVGSHTDEILHLREWKRVPDITLKVPFVNNEATIRSPFGGLVYAILPKSSDTSAITIETTGGIPAPSFTLGQDEAAWRTAATASTSPWIEVGTSKVIFTLPRENALRCESLTKTLEFWDRVLDAHADLACRPRDRERPERLVADVQISAGYMHAGYPIMTHMDAADFMLDLPNLQNGEKAWGFFHELGHNHQHRDWTFDGTGEVTVNLFTMHALETICTNVKQGGHDGAYGDAIKAKAREYLAAAAVPNSDRFEKIWKRDPFLALQMYIQLRQAFGWETYKKVFTEYRDLPDAQRPKTDLEKHDQWMERFSNATGKNLGPFFELWGVPTTAAARERVSKLAHWDIPPIQ